MTESKKRSRSDTSEPEEKKKSEKYYDEEGDLEIISSDGVTFKVNAYILQTCSPVFRDMVKLGSTSTKKPLELDDKELECAETISDVLDILSTSNDIISLPVAESISVFRFMKKYAMDRELDRIGLQLQAGIVNRKNAFMIWLLATEAEMFEVAGRAIENLGSFTWTGELPKERREIQGEHVSKGHVFDFTTWDLDLYRLVPREAVWALGRASRKVSTFDPKPTPAELKSMGEEYTRLMKLPKECKSCEI